MKPAFLLGLLLLPFLIQAENPREEEQLARFLLRFPEADRNKDGTLTIEEARAYRESQKNSPTNDRSSRKREKIPPTHPDISYGEHERNRIDLWIPEGEGDGHPFPLLIFFHGGGFVSGDKSSFTPDAYLEAGIACASANYRLVDGVDTLSPTPFEDAIRAVQTIRHRAREWNLDGGRIALSGGSAGAVISLWIAYQDDRADPEAEDPISRQSTRVTCVVPLSAPTNLMPDWIIENIGGSQQVHGSYAKLFGAPVTLPVPDEMREQIRKVSPWEFVSADDPPTYLIYSGPLDETPLPESASPGKVIHHPAFGAALKQRLDELGVENEFRHGFDPRGTPSIADYLRTQFGMLE